MCQYIPIPLVLSCTGIDMYHDLFTNGNIQIQPIIHTNTTGIFPPRGSKRTRIGMFCGMFWYVFGMFHSFSMFWYVFKTFLTHGFAASTGGIGTYWVRICSYFGMY